MMKRRKREAVVAGIFDGTTGAFRVMTDEELKRYKDDWRRITAEDRVAGNILIPGTRIIVDEEGWRFEDE